MHSDAQFCHAVLHRVVGVKDVDGLYHLSYRHNFAHPASIDIGIIRVDDPGSISLTQSHRFLLHVRTLCELLQEIRLQVLGDDQRDKTSDNPHRPSNTYKNPKASVGSPTVAEISRSTLV